MTHDYYDYISANIEEWINMGFSIKTIAKHYKLDEEKAKSILRKQKEL